MTRYFSMRVKSLLTNPYLLFWSIAFIEFWVLMWFFVFGKWIPSMEEAVRVLEDDENFNAGYGSVLALDGSIYMDASIMCGRLLEAGAVCSVQNIKHPITLARKIMQFTDHILLTSPTAQKLAKKY